MIIAIDGPSGSGKSSTARAVAEKLGFLYLDTGAMYRMVTLVFLNSDVRPGEREAKRILDEGLLDSIDLGEGNRFFLNGTDVSSKIRSVEVSKLVSAVSALKTVRRALVRLQRQIADRHAASGGGVVMDGRDIGTVVFPNADVKIFMSADLDVRARRRHAELAAQGSTLTLDAVRSDLHRRDKLDSSRAVSPLKKAEDAVVIDTSSLSFDEQVDMILELVKNRHTSPSLI